jgi:hypothetical protein
MEELAKLLAAASSGTSSQAKYQAMREASEAARNRSLIHAILVSSFVAPLAHDLIWEPLGNLLEASLWAKLRRRILAAFTPEIPPLSDILRFTVREVYDPQRRKELLSVPTPKEAYEYGKLHGLPPEHVDDYWAAHWELPPVAHLIEMRRRGLIDEATFERYIRYHDYDPTMIPKFAQLIWEPFNRVDLRRMWDLRLISDEEFLKEMQWLGYDERHAKLTLTWLKAYYAVRDLRAMYARGWVTEEDIRKALTEAGVPPERLNEVVMTIVKAAKPERIEKQRELSKAEIIKGVKKGVITLDQGRDLLQRLGYEEWEADFILATELAVMTGSPETYAEFEAMVERWRKAAGLPAKEIPPELIELQKRVAELEAKAAEMRASGASEEQVRPLVEEAGALRRRIAELTGKLPPAKP